MTIFDLLINFSGDCIMLMDLCGDNIINACLHLLDCIFFVVLSSEHTSPAMNLEDRG